METGIAIEGPRHGVKLTASVDWDGRVVNEQDDAGAIKRYYPGRYRWSAMIPAWVWVPAAEATKGARSARTRGHGKKP